MSQQLIEPPKNKKMSKKSRWILIAVLSLLFLAMIVRLATNKKKINEANVVVDKSNITIPVNVTTPQLRQVSQTLIKSGTLIPYEEADISASMAGKLTSIRFQQGSRVSQGSVVATVDQGLENLGLNDARIRLAKLEKDYRIQQELLAADGTTQSRLDEVKMQLDAARNQVAQMRKQVSDNHIIAPISGIVTQKLAVAGEYVSPGMLLGKIVDISRMKVQVMLGESDVYSLRIGQSVKINTQVEGYEVLTGKISFISPQGDAAHNYPVEITISNPRQKLKAGTIVEADFSTESDESTLQIPRSALAESIQNPYVYLTSGGVAKKQKIAIGRNLGNYLEVTDGLTTSDTIVASGLINVTEGTKLKVLK